MVEGGWANAAETSDIRNVKLVIEYDGTDFCGSQLQRGQRTVQAELESAVERLTEVRTRVTFAGRTDTGVHAIGQVANFKTRAGHSEYVFRRALNALLPDDIAVLEASFVPLRFHARFDARWREYRYSILNRSVPSPLRRRFMLHVREPLRLETMQSACEALEGEQDFASFAGAAKGSPLALPGSGKSGRGTVRRVLRASCRQTESGGAGGGDQVDFEIVADAFLPHMVRNIVGTLLLVGQGRLEVEEFRRILAARDRSQAGPTAPAHGLTLVRIEY
jgi:tRNA pseudouridine38-40 synthase